MNEPEVIRYVGDRGLRTRTEAAAYIADHLREQGEGHGLGLCRVALRASSTPIGICGLLQRPALDAPDLGFAFRAAYEGQGYAAEASQAVLQAAQDQLGLTTVTAITNVDNPRAVRLLQRLGFTYERLAPVGAEGTLFRLYQRSLDPPGSHER